MKPEDWLIDYSTAASIANGNRRVAVKYVPLMLQGTAHTWLNNLEPYSVNSWLDFTEVFVRNFTSMYKRPPKPRQLSLCVQGPSCATLVKVCTRCRQSSTSPPGAERAPSSSTDFSATSLRLSMNC